MKARTRSNKWLDLYTTFLAAFFYLIPMYVMLVTGLKGFDEVSLKTMWDLPKAIRFDNFIEAYDKLAPYLWNSFNMVFPAAIISSILGSLNGYVLAKWKFKGAEYYFPGNFIWDVYSLSKYINPVGGIHAQYQYVWGFTGAGACTCHLWYTNHNADIPQLLCDDSKRINRSIQN